ncbi:hypothetical protein [Acidovorax sp.]|uniref:hypothetical protein n=1 Tax=Acidovorax sp. TaxID=1872122 RepID=UPI002ACE6260|nr:hypothetical protein [Acidovorax sp.]MDZ7863390.1 hypothetical protein [Acidovorax sp.]
MGRSISTNLDSLDQPVSVFAGEAIAQGNLVKITQGGYVHKVLEAQSLAAQNNSAPAPVTSANMTTNYGDATSGGASFQNILAMANGGFAHAFPGNGSAASTGMNLGFYSPLAALGMVTVLGSAATSGSAKLAFAGADNIAVAWQEASNIMLAIVNHTTGAIVAAAANVGNATTSAISWDLIRLASGEVVVAYPNATDMVFKRYSASGALQGAMTVVEAAVTPSWVVLLPLAAGGFIVRYARTAATAGLRMARFNAAGVMQGAVVQITSGANLYEGPLQSAVVGAMRGKIIELSNGNIVTNHPSVPTVAAFKLYDSSLNLLATVNMAAGLNSGYGELPQFAPKAGGGFWATPMSPTVVNEYTNTGVLVRSSGNSTAPFGTARIIDRPGNGPLVMSHNNTPGSASSWTLNSLKPDLSALEATGTLVYNNGSNGYQSHWTEMLTTGYSISITQGTSQTFGTLNLMANTAMSVLGVATQAAAAGAAVKVATAGKFTMTQNLTSPAFDRRAATPPGTKGATFGNSAVLSGING